jgi:hypothetical protein
MNFSHYDLCCARNWGRILSFYLFISITLHTSSILPLVVPRSILPRHSRKPLGDVVDLPIRSEDICEPQLVPHTELKVVRVMRWSTKSQVRGLAQGSQVRGCLSFLMVHSIVIGSLQKIVIGTSSRWSVSGCFNLRFSAALDSSYFI